MTSCKRKTKLSLAEWVAVHSPSKMRSMARNATLACLVMLSSPSGSTQVRETPSALVACTSELRLPTFSDLARSMAPSVTVNVRLRVEATGQAGRLDFEGGSDGHRSDVRMAIQRSRFLPECSGKVLSLKFTYEISGAPDYSPPVTVTYRPPNHFILRTNPILPTADRTNIPK